MATVKYTLNPKNPPKMSDAEKARFDAIKDGDIDYSDIPEQFPPKSAGVPKR